MNWRIFRINWRMPGINRELAILVGLAILALLPPVEIVLSLIYDSLALYWISLFIATVVIIIAAQFFTPIADALGFYFGKLIRDNNYRWFTMVGLSVIFTISAFIAGFGEPVINKEVVRPGIKMAEEVSQPWSVEISKRWNGEQAVAVASQAPASSPIKVKSYHSWYHIKFAIFLWIVTFIYMFFAFSDEAKEAWQEVIATVKSGVESGLKRSMETVTITSGDQTQTQAQGQATEAVESFFKRHFGRLLSLELIVEFIANFVGKMLKKMSKSF